MAHAVRFSAFGRARFSHWLGLAVVGTAFLTAAALTWRKWPDILIDFGMQLYLPWKLSSGSVLYRDLIYLTGGPLSQYCNALLFKLFGTSFQTLFLSNLVLAGGLLILIYRRFLAASDTWTATLICLGIVLVFTFGQYLDVGNYNFMAPYCHEVWHGLVISIVAVGLLSDWVTKERIAAAAGAGFCAGLVFLTKPEVFLALAVCAAAALGLSCAARRPGDFVLKSAAAFLLAGLAAPLGFFAYFLRVEGWQASLRSVAFAWTPLLGSSVSNEFFYRWCLGLDAPGHNLLLMLIHFAALAAIIGVFAALFRRNMETPANRLIAVGAIAGLLALASGFDWMDCGRSLPLVSIVLCLVLGSRYRELSGERSMAFPLLWSVFGLALLSKLGLFSRIWHYGFALAMPAFVGAVYLLFWLLPQLLEKYGVQRKLFRTAVASVLMVGFTRLFVQSQMIYQHKTLTVGRDGDAIRVFDQQTSPTGAAVNSALAWLDQNAPPEATLAVLPEGVMVNYLSRRTNPARYFIWNPAELKAFGQTNMIEAFRVNCPDYVMLVHREAAEYGAKFFGQEDQFGGELLRWIEKNYEPVCLIGDPPLQNSHFGIKILKHLPPIKSSAAGTAEGLKP